MRFYYLSGSYLPSRKASSVHVTRMCSALSRIDGLEVTLLGRQGERCVDYDKVRADYRLAGAVNMYLSPWAKSANLRRLFGVVCNHRCVRIKEKGPDVLYGRDFPSMPFMRGVKVPLYFELHQAPQIWLEKILFRRILRSRNFSGLIVITKALKEECLRQYPELDARDIWVEPDAADIPVQNESSEAPLHPVVENILARGHDRKRIGYTGSLYKGRGINILIDIAEKMPEHDFHILGGSPEEVLEWGQAARSDNVFFYGYIQPGYLADITQLFDVLVAPYQEKILIGNKRDIAKWISPLKLFEYMAAEKPIVISGIPVIKEVVTHDREVLMVPPTDVSAWVEAIGNLINNPQTAERLARTAHEAIKEKYSWDARARRIMKKIEERIKI